MASVFLKHSRTRGRVFEMRKHLTENSEIAGKKEKALQIGVYLGVFSLRPENQIIKKKLLYVIKILKFSTN